MRIRVLAILLWVSVVAIGQTRFDLLPENMRQYVGKVSKDTFESVIGSPIGYEEGFYYYEVVNTYDETLTGIRCLFRPSDNRLISVRFTTCHYGGYWIGFAFLKGFPKGAVARRQGNLHMKKDPLGNIQWINLRLQGFGCNIFDIRQHQGFSTAIINYHIY